MNAIRYAIYFSPPARSPLATLGASWLGHNCDNGTAIEPPRLAGISSEAQAALTRAPRRYGFHATLKPPFHLAPGAILDDLRQSLRALATRASVLCLPSLEVRARPFLGLGAEPGIEGAGAACSSLRARFGSLSGPSPTAGSGTSTPGRSERSAGDPDEAPGLSLRHGGLSLPHDPHGPA